MSGAVAARAGRWRIAARTLLAVLCGSFAAAAETQAIRIALAREASAAPLLVGIASRAFAAEGLEPQLIFLASDASASTAVANGKADVGLAGLSAPFYRFAATHGLKMIASRSRDKPGFPTCALLVSQKARAAGLSDVRGLSRARIGVASTDSDAYYALFRVASRFSLDGASLQTTPLKSPEAAVEALTCGKVDVALLPLPAAVRSARAGRGSLIFLSDFAEWQQGVVFTTAKNIAARRSLIERFMRAYQRGAAEYELDFLQYDDAGDFIPGPHYESYLGSVARQVGTSAAWVAMTRPYCDRRANLDVADIERQVRFWQGRGALDKNVAPGELLDVSFIGAETVPTR